MAKQHFYAIVKGVIQIEDRYLGRMIEKFEVLDVWSNDRLICNSCVMGFTKKFQNLNLKTGTKIEFEANMEQYEEFQMIGDDLKEEKCTVITKLLRPNHVKVLA